MSKKTRFTRWTLLAQDEKGQDFDVSSHVSVGLDSRINHFLDELQDYWDEDELDPIVWETSDDSK